MKKDKETDLAKLRDAGAEKYAKDIIDNYDGGDIDTDEIASGAFMSGFDAAAALLLEENKKLKEALEKIAKKEPMKVSVREAGDMGCEFNLVARETLAAIRARGDGG